MAQWLSWLERRPVTAKVESSSLFWVVSNELTSLVNCIWIWTYHQQYLRRKYDDYILPPYFLTASDIRFHKKVHNVE